MDTWPEVLIHFVGFFAQDDFRVTRNLSVQLGLRWDLMTRPVENRTGSRTSACRTG